MATVHGKEEDGEDGEDGVAGVEMVLPPAARLAVLPVVRREVPPAVLVAPLAARLKAPGEALAVGEAVVAEGMIAGAHQLGGEETTLVIHPLAARLAVHLAAPTAVRPVAPEILPMEAGTGTGAVDLVNTVARVATAVTAATLAAAAAAVAMVAAAATVAMVATVTSTAATPPVPRNQAPPCFDCVYLIQRNLGPFLSIFLGHGTLSPQPFFGLGVLMS